MQYAYGYALSFFGENEIYIYTGIYVYIYIGWLVVNLSIGELFIGDAKVFRLSSYILYR